jgi:hypothetical protein
LQTVAEEREVLYRHGSDDLGELLDVSAPPENLVATLLLRLGLH